MSSMAAGGRPEHAWSLKDRPSMAIGEEAADGVQAAPLFSPWEAEQRIENLTEFDVVDVGSSLWMKQHEALEQLNLQAHQSAQQQGDEFVLEALLTFDKLRTLVHELLATEAWRVNVFPRIKGALVQGKATMRGYFCLYHEATLVNLLCVCMHHAHATESLGETAVDLVDYVSRRLVEMNAKGRTWSKKGEGSKSAEGSVKAVAVATEPVGDPLSDLESQAEDILFQLSVATTTLARYLCEHMNSLPLSVLTRATDTHDLLCCIVPLIENPPWTRRTKEGQWQKLVENKWVDYAPADLLTLTKTEGQLWLALFHIICNNEIRKRYHFNSFRKGQLLRARKYINEVLLDQLPVLADVQRFMDELSLMEVPEPTAQQGGSSVLLMEQVSVVQEKLVKERDWDAVVKHQLESIFSKQTDATDKDLRRLVDNVYALDGVEDVLGEAPIADLYAQELVSLSLTVLGPALLEDPAKGPPRSDYARAGKPKPLTTQHGPFIRQKWVPGSAVDEVLHVGGPLAGPASEGKGAEGGGTGAGATMLKAEVAFVGASPFQSALCSDPIDFPEGDKPSKLWVQLGSLKDKLAIQVQLVRTETGAPFRVGDAFVSAPAPQVARD